MLKLFKFRKVLFKLFLVTTFNAKRLLNIGDRTKPVPFNFKNPILARKGFSASFASIA